ncbi:hypothetical protein [Nocardioides sp.]|uniref:glycosyltransferase family 2 protein n=1 Tax=Nocardioides sp. TaxID=35761 RepID=UPI002B26C367|nr:hypothetical protein [Nocardioides sp.]
MTDQLPPPVRGFLDLHPGATVLGADTVPGLALQVAVIARDVTSLRTTPCPHGVLARAIGVFLREGAGAPVVVPRPEWPVLRSLRSRRAKAGWWTVLRFAEPVDVAAVLGEIAAQSTWGSQAVARPVLPGATGAPGALDPRVINPIGFLAEAPEPVQDLADLDISAGVTPALVASLRQARGVRWDPAAPAPGSEQQVVAAVEGLALAGVPVTLAGPSGGAGLGPGPDPRLVPGLDPRLVQALGAPVDLDDEVAREEHSLVARRAAYDLVTARSGSDAQPSVSVLLATRRADMLDFALAQVARQRGVARLELVLAPHGFDVDAQSVRDRVGPDVAVQVLPHAADVMFGDVLEAAARAAGGDVVLKMDDDDWYAPDVVADLLRARGYSGAELVGMPAELHYLTDRDLTVKRGHPMEFYAKFVAGGTMLLDRSVLREVGGFRSVKKYVDAQLIASVLAAGGAVYRTHGLGYVLRRNPTGHTWQVDSDYLLDPSRTRAIWPGFCPSRLLEPDPRHRPVPTT